MRLTKSGSITKNSSSGRHMQLTPAQIRPGKKVFNESSGCSMGLIKRNSTGGYDKGNAVD